MYNLRLGSSRTRWAVLVLALSVLLAVSGAWAAGKPAPDFTLPDIQGKEYTLSSLKGKVVVLNFFTVWCMPCRAEMPDLNKIYLENKDKGLHMFGVCLKADPVQLRFLVKQIGLNYPVLNATDKVDQDYGSVAIVPTTFIIDKQGNIVHKIEGTRKKEQFEKLIQPLL
jgi:peroxiredoxin